MVPLKDYFSHLAEVFAEEKPALIKLYNEQIKKRASLLEALMGSGRNFMAARS